MAEHVPKAQGAMEGAAGAGLAWAGVRVVVAAAVVNRCAVGCTSRLAYHYT